MRIVLTPLAKEIFHIFHVCAKMATEALCYFHELIIFEIIIIWSGQSKTKRFFEHDDLFFITKGLIENHMI